jgi:hypothetical protein
VPVSSKSFETQKQLTFSYPQIYKYYFDLAQIFSRRGLRILKTDSHNESRIFPHSIPLMPVLSQGNFARSIEIDDNILDLAKRNFPSLDFVSGDIRTLSDDQAFDAVLDFSTIDHVQRSELISVLGNYKRSANFVSIIVWLSDTRPDRKAQSYFPKSYFENSLSQFFGSDYVSTLLFSDKDAQLFHYLAGTGPAADLIDEILELGAVSLLVNKEAKFLWSIQTSPPVRWALRLGSLRRLAGRLYYRWLAR